MAVDVTGRHAGNLRMELTHGPSARSGPVRLSLRPELDTAVEFVYPD